MISSSAGFLIGTPSKCGATTVEDVARRYVRECGIDGDQFRMVDWASPRRKHAMSLPPIVRDATGDMVIMGHAANEEEHIEWEGHDRWLLTRNPFARYVSLYKYLSLPRNYSQWGAKQLQGWDWGGPRAEFMKAERRRETWHHRPKMTFNEFMVWYSDEREKLKSPRSVRRRGSIEEGRAYRSPWVWTDSLIDCHDLLAAQPAGSDEGVVDGYLVLERLWLGKYERGSLAHLFATYGMDPDDVGKPLHANKTRAWGSERYGVYRDVTFAEEFWGGFGLSAEGVSLAEFRHQCSGMSCGLCRSGVVNEYLWWVTALAT